MVKHPSETAGQKKEELHRLIKQTEEYKKRVRTIVRDLGDQYKRGIISHDVYKAKINHTFGNKKPLALLKHYDECIKQYKRSLRKEITAEKKAQKFAALPKLVILFLLIGGIVAFNPLLTGFLSLGEKELALEEHLDLLTQQDTVYRLDMPAEGELKSLAVSGTLEGEGAVQIYLKDEQGNEHLVYDSAEDIERKGLFSLFTGFIVATANTTFGKKINFSLVDENGAVVPANLDESGNLLTITPEVSFIEKIELEDVVGTVLGLSGVARGIVEPEEAQFVKVYSLDANNLGFSQAKVYATSEGNTLYSCPFWDFSLSVCLSTWNRLKSLEERKEYSIPFDVETVAFAEAVQSSGNATNNTPSQEATFPLTPLDIATTSFTLGEVAKFNTLVRNDHLEEASEVSSRIVLSDETGEVADFSSAVTTVPAEGVKNLIAYWDTGSLLPGVYAGILTLTAEGEQEVYNISMNITAESATTQIFGITGMVVSGGKGSSSKQKSFASKCVETCNLQGLQQSSYSILIVVKNALLNLTNIEFDFKTNETIIVENITALQEYTNITTFAKGVKGILIDNTKITYTDERRKLHKLKRYELTEGNFERGHNWERTCEGNICEHKLYNYERFYEKEDGTFDEVQNALTDQDCEQEVCVKSKNHRVEFKEKASETETIQVTKDNITLSLTPLQIRYEENDTQAILSSANIVTGEAEDNKYTYPGIFGQNTALSITYEGTRLKEEIIFTEDDIIENNNLQNSTGYITIDYLIDTNTLDWYVEEKAIGTLAQDEFVTTNASLHLKKDTETPSTFIISESYLFTENGDVPLTTQLTHTAGQEILSIQVPITHFQTNTYPLVVDPTVELTFSEQLWDGMVREDPDQLPIQYNRFGGAEFIQIGKNSIPSTCSTGAQTCRQRAAIEWELFSIPANARIFDLNLTFRGTESESNTETELFLYELTDNHTTYANTNNGNSNFFEDMGDGDLYHQEAFPSSFQHFSMNITGTALVADMHTALFDQEGWWGMGMRSNESVGCESGCDTAAINSEDHGTAAFRPLLTVTYDLPSPAVILESPANESYYIDFINETLNFTILDNEPFIREIVLYGGPAEEEPVLNEHIIAIYQNVSNGTKLRYNWTTPYTLPEFEHVLLVHFDNRSNFGETAALVLDFSNQSNNGTVTGSADSCIAFNASDAKLGGVRQFQQGNSAHASCSAEGRNITFGDQDELIGPTDYTWMMWLKIENTSVNGTILNKYDSLSDEGLFIRYLTGGNLLVNTDGQELLVSNFFTEHVYTHLAITTDSASNMIVYKDGENATPPTSFSSITENNVPLEIGIETDAYTDSFVGAIDELMIWNTSLTDWQVKDKYRLKGDKYFWAINATDLSQDTNGTNRSILRELQIGLAPELTLNWPLNASVHNSVADLPNLNTTLIDRDLSNSLLVQIYGSNKTIPSIEDLLWQELNIGNGTVITYNWTAPVSNAGDDTALVLHFDNRSIFGENDSNFLDFSVKGFNATCEGSQCPIVNMSGGKFAGGVEFDAINDVLLIDDNEQWDSPPFSVAFWMRASQNATEQGDAYLVTLADTNAFLVTWAILYNDPDDRVYWVVIGDDCAASFIFVAGETRVVKDRWYHIVAVVNETNSSAFYINGQEDTSSQSITSLCEQVAASRNLIAGALTTAGAASFNGTLDDIVFYNRTLNAEEVADMYELKDGKYYWFANATDNFTLRSSEQTDTWEFTLGNDNPTVAGVTLAPDPANTTDQFNCTFTVSDQNAGDALSANISFFNGTTLAESYNISVTTGVLAGQAATAGLQAKHENWTCGVVPFDGTNEGDQVNSSTVLVVNSVPPLPALGGPPDNFVTTNVLPSFNWTNVTDADGDMVNYTFNLTCYSTAGGSCTAPGDDRLFNVTGNSTEPDGDLKFKIDDGFYYNWTVLAHDGENQSVYALARTFNITALVAISLSVNNVDFQTMGLGETNNTADDIPRPFNLTNDGNSFIEVNLSALAEDADLFDSVSVPSIYYQFKGANRSTATLVAQVLNQSRSIIDWTNVGSDNQTIFAGFNYSAPTDLAEIDINVTVPLDEPQGSKGATIQLTGYYIGGAT